MKIYPFPSSVAPHFAYIKDRKRNSGLTSVRFVADNRVVCCDFNEKSIYLAEFNETEITLVDTKPTIVKDGTPVQTDLLDVNKSGLAVVSNFYQGTQSFYQIAGDTLKFYKELEINETLKFQKVHKIRDALNIRRWFMYDKMVGCHGVRFIPGYDDLLWVSYCGTNNRFVMIVDYKRSRVLHKIPMTEQLQDAAFVGPYVIVPARTDHITVAAANEKNMYATLYLFRLPKNLRFKPPELIDTWKGKGHLDAMKEYRDRVYSANQYTDEVDVFHVTEAERLEQLPSIGGFSMPHGLDIRHDGLMAVTNYGDNSLRLVQLHC